MSNLQKYGGYSEEAAKAEQEELEKGGGDFMKLEVGKNVIRILPPPIGHTTPFIVVHQHFIKLPGMDSPASFNCFSGDTRFWANGKLYALRDIVGETVEVLTKDGTWRSAEVSSFGVKKTQRVVLHAYHAQTVAMEFVATPDHRWFTSNRGEVTDLKVRDRVTVTPRTFNTDDLSYRNGFVHGVVFGDGARAAGPGRFQLRLCGTKAKHLDAVKGHAAFTSVSFPPSCNGDPIAQFKSLDDFKSLPNLETSFEYQAGFLAGWLAMDGSQVAAGANVGACVDLTSTNAEALAWLVERAPLLGYCTVFVGTPREDDTNYGPRTRPLGVVRLRPEATEYVVRAIIDEGVEEETFCVTEPVTGSFTLENGVVTGNCPRMMQRKACPACAEVDRLRATGNPVDYTNAGDLLPKLRVYAKVIDRKHPEMGPRTLAFGKSIHKVLVSIREEGDFTHPIEGWDIVIERKGTGKNDTEYSTRAARTNTKLAETEEQMDDWIAAQGDGAMLARVPTPQEIGAILNLPAQGSASSTGGGAPPAGRRATRTASDDMESIDTTGNSVDDA
jgi:hypothetical protein